MAQKSNLWGKGVVAVDLDRRDLAMCTTFNKNGNTTFLCCSNEECLEKIGSAKALQWQLS